MFCVPFCNVRHDTNEPSTDIGIRLAKDMWFVSNTLPYIFLYLESEDVLRCTRVCKLWRHVAKDCHCWRKLTIKHHILDVEWLTWFVYDRDVRSLTLIECSFKPSRIERRPWRAVKKRTNYGSRKLTDLYTLRLCYLDNLRHLSLFGLHQTDLNNFYTYNHLLTNSTLESLALSTQDLGARFYDFLRSLKVLKKLQLVSLDRWNPISLFKCISVMNNLVCLELLKVHRHEYFYYESEREAIGLCTNLKELTIIPEVRFSRSNMLPRIFPDLSLLKGTLEKLTYGFSVEDELTHPKKFPRFRSLANWLEECLNVAEICDVKYLGCVIDLKSMYRKV